MAPTDGFLCVSIYCFPQANSFQKQIEVLAFIHLNGAKGSLEEPMKHHLQVFKDHSFIQISLGEDAYVAKCQHFVNDPSISKQLFCGGGHSLFAKPQRCPQAQLDWGWDPMNSGRAVNQEPI